jgi:hypothetical protein
MAPYDVDPSALKRASPARGTPLMSRLIPSGLIPGGALAFVVLAFAATLALAQELETLPLRYRTAEQVLPVLRPLVEPGGVLTGMQSTLFIRASRRNIEQVKQALAALDTMPRRLVISVRQDAGVDASASGVGASGRIGSDGSRVDARVYSSRSASDERVSQSVQTLEGSPAYISIGQSVPIQTQTITATITGPIVTETTGYRDVATGFSVVPRLNGDQVILEISPQRESLARGNQTPGVPGQGPPGFDSQRIVTTASGRLGEWIDLGGAVQAATASERGILSSRDAARQDNRRVQVRVEALP